MTKNGIVFRSVLLLTILCVAGATVTWAADITARIRGTVSAPDGSVVPNATLNATNTQTGISYPGKTGNEGTFEILNLPIGTYTLSAQAPGFQSFTATGITLSIDQIFVQDVKLVVGSVSQTVEVIANTVQVDTTNIQLSNVINSQQIVDLPLIGRNFTQLELLIPGVQASNDRFGTFSANGAQTQQSSFLINGTDTNDLPLNTPVYIPSPDAIGQFNFVTSSLNPEYSRNSGAIVSATFKNGTNSFHGDAFDFYRNTFLNTHNYFQKTAPKLQQNVFGGTLGGPIWKDKAFFFLSYQGIRATQPQATSQQSVYTAAELNGDFSSDLVVGGTNGTRARAFSSKPIPGTIHIPGCTTGEAWNKCLVGGIVPGGAASFNPIAAAFVKKFVPLPNTGVQGFQFNAATKTVQDQGIARFDVNPTSKDSFLGILVIQHAPSSDDLPFTGATLPGFGDINTRETHQFTASWTHIFNPTTLNELRAAYTRFNFGAVNPQQVVLPSSQGFAITPQNLAVAGTPVMGVSGFFTLGFSSNGPQPRLDQTRQIDDNFTKTIGRHSLKFGFDGRRFNVDNPFFASNSGTFGFSTSNPFGTGDTSLDYLLGMPSSYTQGTGAVINAYAYESYFYGQDVWKIRDNLTLTMGAGLQTDTALHNRQFKGVGVVCFLPGQQSKIFPTAPLGLDYPGDPGCNDAQGSKTSHNFGPRIGFAYSPTLGRLSAGESHKLVIRGGFGVYANRTEEESSLQNLQDPPFGFGSSGALDFGQRPAFQNPFQELNSGVVHPNRFPGTFPAPGAANVVFNPPFTQGLSQYAPGYKAPYAMNFNLTIQRELPSNIIATVSYVGSLGRHEQTTVDGNPITPAGQAACAADPTCVANRDSQSLLYPSHTQFGAVTTLPNGLNTFPGEGFVSTGGKSSYNALQLSATKGYSHGLIFQASYTWSHSLDDASSFEGAGFGSTSRGYNQYAPALNWGNSSFDSRHRFVFSPVYTIPNLHGIPGLHWLPDVIGKGFQISGISTFATGFPFDITYFGGESYSLFCSANFYYYACPDSPSQVGPLTRVAPRAGGPGKPVVWFNNANGSIIDEPIGTFGNIGRNKYHGPGILNTDMAIEKSIYPWKGNENRYLQLRLEGYNVFNHTQFSNPTSNFDSGNFGIITSAAAGRLVQLGLKIYF